MDGLKAFDFVNYKGVIVKDGFIANNVIGGIIRVSSSVITKDKGYVASYSKDKD